MGKVIASASMSLDGFVADPSDQVGPNGGRMFERPPEAAFRDVSFRGGSWAGDGG